MTREEAEAVARRSNAEHEDRRTHHWIAKQTDDEWVVVKIGVPLDRASATTSEQRGAERPPAADPPGVHERNVGGPWVGGR